MSAGLVFPRGRRCLAATVRGPAAAWLYNLASGRAEDSIRHFASIGDIEKARAIGDAVADLREAATQWHEASGHGTPEVPAVPLRPELVSPPSGVFLREGVDVRGASRALRVSERRVRQLLAAGALRGAKDRTGRWSVDKDDLERLCGDRDLSR